LKTLCRFSPRVPRATLKQPEPAGLSSLDRFHGLLPTAASMLPTNAHANDLIPDLNGSDSSWPISTEMGGKSRSSYLQSIRVEVTVFLQQQSFQCPCILRKTSIGQGLFQNCIL
jgi:hypothetical protein